MIKRKGEKRQKVKVKRQKKRRLIAFSFCLLLAKPPPLHRLPLR